MSSKLFAFQVAKPIESGVHETTSAEYDSESQRLIWSGGTRPQAAYNLFCTGGYNYRHCNAYGDYCNAWGFFPIPTGYICDGVVG